MEGGSERGGEGEGREGRGSEGKGREEGDGWYVGYTGRSTI